MTHDDSFELSLLDDGSDRADLAARREAKYVFTRTETARLRSTLARTCRPIVYANPVSTVSSVYFDGAQLGTCRANFDGVGLRHKTRIRWYDRPAPGDHFFFETKWRRHRLCGKQRLRVGVHRSAQQRTDPGDAPRQDIFGTVPYHRILAGLRGALPLAQQGHLHTDTAPVVLVEYKREHFAHHSGKVRLTLDYDLRFYPQLGRRSLSRRFAEYLPGVTLIECKGSAQDMALLDSVLKPLRTRASRFSKYVIGCQRLGYAADF